VIVAAPKAGSYEERTCSRCFEGRVYYIARGAWVDCERCSGTARVVVYVYPRPKRSPR
jgi:PHP family Zn ribbon phosphoesterase